jgi:hypothetical protein
MYFSRPSGGCGRSPVGWGRGALLRVLCRVWRPPATLPVGIVVRAGRRRAGGGNGLWTGVCGAAVTVKCRSHGRRAIQPALVPRDVHCPVLGSPAEARTGLSRSSRVGSECYSRLSAKLDSVALLMSEPSIACRPIPRARTLAATCRRGSRQSEVGRSKRRAVEVAGIEPASFGCVTGLLRAQPAVLFSAPAVTQASCRRAQLLLGVPIAPAAGSIG